MLQLEADSPPTRFGVALSVAFGGSGNYIPISILTSMNYNDLETFNDIDTPWFG